MTTAGLTAILRTIRSMGFGASLGVGVVFLLQMLGIIAADYSRETLILAGVSAGGGLHAALDAIVVQGVLRPIGGFVAFYGGLAEALVLGQMLPPEERNRLIKGKIRRRIQGTDTGRALPKYPKRRDQG